MDSIAARAALGALAQTTRLETFRLLVRHEPRGIPAGELARRRRLDASDADFPNGPSPETLAAAHAKMSGRLDAVLDALAKANQA